MKHFKLVVCILIVSNFFTIVNGQEEYIDLSYGDQGIIEIPSIGYIGSFFDFGIDQENRTYLSRLNHSFDTLDPIRARYLLARFDLNGKQEKDWGFDIEIDTNNLNQQLEIFWLDNNLLLSHDRYKQDDTLTDIKVYNTELSLVKQFTVTEDRQLSFPYNDFSVTFPLLDHNGELLHVSYGTLRKYKSADGIDLNFGDNGSSQLFELQSLEDSLYQTHARLIEDKESEAIIYASANYYEDASSSRRRFVTRIAKLNESGELENNFGKDGYYQLDTSTFLANFIIEETGGYSLFNIKTFQENCYRPSEYELIKITENGTVDIDFANQGYFQISESCAPYQPYSNNLLLPDGSHLIVFYDVEYHRETKQYKYHLKKLYPDGSWDNTFCDDGRLQLDRLQGTNIRILVLDNDYNLFISGDELGPTLNDSKPYILKLKGEKLWEDLVPASKDDPLDLIIYPNPSISIPLLKNVGRNRSELTISLFDISGRLVSKRYIEKLERNMGVAISDRQLSVGTYLVRVSDAFTKSTFWEKLVVVVIIPLCPIENKLNNQ